MSIKMAMLLLGFVAGGGEARRKVREGAVRVNNVQIDDPEMTLCPGRHKITVGRYSDYINVVAP